MKGIGLGRVHRGPQHWQLGLQLARMALLMLICLLFIVSWWFLAYYPSVAVLPRPTRTYLGWVGFVDVAAHLLDQGAVGTTSSSSLLSFMKGWISGVFSAEHRAPGVEQIARGNRIAFVEGRLSLDKVILCLHLPTYGTHLPAYLPCLPCPAYPAYLAYFASLNELKQASIPPSIRQMLTALVRNNVRRVVVTDGEGWRVAGVVTRSTVVSYLASHAPQLGDLLHVPVSHVLHWLAVSSLKPRGVIAVPDTARYGVKWMARRSMLTGLLCCVCIFVCECVRLCVPALSCSVRTALQAAITAGVSGVPIVDGAGRITANLSASDVGVFATLGAAATLEDTAKLFDSNIVAALKAYARAATTPARSPFVAQERDAFGTVLSLMAEVRWCAWVGGWGRRGGGGQHGTLGL